MSEDAKRRRIDGAGGEGARIWDLALINCRLATMCAGPTAPQHPYGAADGGEPTGVLGVKDGNLVFVGSAGELPRPAAEMATEVYDACRRWVTPGLIDCHTHLVYGGDRAAEWELKLKGATYEEVAMAGGGIVNTVEGTRAATVEELVASARPRVRSLLEEGVTSIEIKSGYGLELGAERKMLQAARAIAKEFNIDSPATFLGAHAVPREYKGNADAYIDEVLRMLDILHGEGLVDCVDAFCETIGFTAAQTRRVFDKAKALGLPTRLHGDQLHDFSGAELTIEYGSLSLDHCEYTNPAHAKAMADAGVVAVLLPSSNFFIKEKQRPPVEAFRREGVAMAVATNCNPGSSPCASLLLCMHMACTLFGLTPEEALAGVTRHAAQAMGFEQSHGTLAIGKVADIAVWDVNSLCELSYYLGLGGRLVACFKHGKRRQAFGAGSVGDLVRT